MQRMFYYARLNNSSVCVGFTKSTTKLEETEYLVDIVDENESLIYKKWQGKDKGWTQETYEPSIDSVFQGRLDQLEEENTELNHNVTTLNQTINTLEGTINELMLILGGMQ